MKTKNPEPHKAALGWIKLTDCCDAELLPGQVKTSKSGCWRRRRETSFVFALDAVRFPLNNRLRRRRQIAGHFRSSAASAAAHHRDAVNSGVGRRSSLQRGNNRPVG